MPSALIVEAKGSPIPQHVVQQEEWPIAVTSLAIPKVHIYNLLGCRKVQAVVGNAFAFQKQQEPGRKQILTVVRSCSSTGKQVGDLMKLEELAALDRMGEKSADNILAALEASKKTILAKFIYALGIREVGESTARNFAKAYGTFEAYSAADELSLQQVPDVGPVVAHFVFEFFQQDSNLAVVSELKAAGIQWPNEIAGMVSHPLAGLTYVLTGTLDALDRDDAKAVERQHAWHRERHRLGLLCLCEPAQRTLLGH